MRLLAGALVALLLACDVQRAVPSVTPPTSASARPTLTALALPADVVAVKSSGRILSIEGTVLVVRIDRVNSGAQRALDDAVVALRIDANTSVQLVATRNDTGVTGMDLRGISVGDPITFMFEPNSFNRDDRSYLARVIGRF